MGLLDTRTGPLGGAVACALTGAALLSGLLPPAQTSREAPEVVRRDHGIEVGEATIHAWEVTLEKVGEDDALEPPVVILLHGGTWSGQPNFDLRFEDYSTMEHFARAGWATFAVDARGYGRSSDPVGESWSEAKDAVRDLRVVVEHILEERSDRRVHLVGWSWGSQVAALFAQEHPELTARVVLYGTRWQALEEAPDAPTERFRQNSPEDARADFIDGCHDPAMAEAYVAAALEADPVSPNGVFRDYFENLPLMDPEKLRAPTLLIAGEHEARDSLADLLQLFAALPTGDKQLAVIPGGGHAVHLEEGRHRWRSAVLAFLGDDRPRKGR